MSYVFPSWHSFLCLEGRSMRLHQIGGKTSPPSFTNRAHWGTVFNNIKAPLLLLQEGGTTSQVPNYCWELSKMGQTSTIQHSLADTWHLVKHNYFSLSYNSIWVFLCFPFPYYWRQFLQTTLVNGPHPRECLTNTICRAQDVTFLV